MGDIDLQKFAMKSGSLCEYLERPFSIGDYSYATNGHIMVRLPRRADIPEIDGAPKVFNVNAPLEHNATASYATPEPFEVTAADKRECFACNGSGKEHNCPDCECECPDCDGTGAYRPNQSISVHGTPVAVNYILMVLALPGAQIAAPRDKEAPIPFRFNGGIGAVMPLREKRADHLGDLKFAAAEAAA